LTSPKRTANIVGVRLEPTGSVQYLDPSGVDVEVGDRVIVETEAGRGEGEVIITPAQVLYSELHDTGGYRTQGMNWRHSSRMDLLWNK
jgi:hypothetical protein